LLPHIIKEPVESAKWNIPENTYPDRQNTVFDTSRWKVEPKKPYIKANLVFLTNPGHVSAGETFLGIIDHYKLGTLVGDTTAGTNGNINMIPLMGDYSIMWTGMKVIKHDGSQHHLIGFKPDYPVSRTIQAIKEGRDEYLEKAKMILEEKIKIAK
jgi:C-terminal processing protease CtpA/Prc